MPRWPIIALGAIAYWASPWLLATLFTIGATTMWFGFSNTYRHAIPLLLIFGALSYYVFGAAHAQNYYNNMPGQVGPGGYYTNMPGQIPTAPPPPSYTINTPGQMPSTMAPIGGGGYVINTPGQMPTTIMPMTPQYGR